MASIGLAVAKEFARRGSHVTIVARTESKLRVAVAEIQLAASADQVGCDDCLCVCGDGKEEYLAISLPVHSSCSCETTFD